MIDVVALGEMLIDFTPYGRSEKGNILYEMNPGGAPANVAAALSKLGKKTAFIGKVGQDSFGSFLCRVLSDNGIHTEGLVFSRETSTTLAFVHLDDDGERSFQFYRNPGADQQLQETDIRWELIKQSCVFHFGSISLTDEPCRTATLKALEFAREKKVCISFDPNYRPHLWPGAEQAKRMITKVLPYVDILKLSREELLLLTETDDYEEGSKQLNHRFRLPLIFVTDGNKGSFCRYFDQTCFVQAIAVQVVDTTGAGDAFLAAALYALLEKNLLPALISNTPSLSDLIDMVTFANKAGGLATTKKGAIPAMPSLEEIKRM